MSQTSRTAAPAANHPTPAFVGASWAALLAGVIAFLTGLYYSGMELSDTGFYFTVLAYGLFSAVSLQKAVRDRMESIPVTPVYFGLAWASVITSLVLLATGLWNADVLSSSEKGFYAMSFSLALFAAVAVQKNVRDTEATRPTGTGDYADDAAPEWGSPRG